MNRFFVLTTLVIRIAAIIIVFSSIGGYFNRTRVILQGKVELAKLIIDKMRESIMSGGLRAKIGGLLIKPALGKVKKLLDPSEEGAAPLLGVNGLVFIGHGRSDAIAIKSAVRVAKEAAEAKVLDAMKSAIEESLKK